MLALMDEVTNGLDEYYRQKVFDRLAQINRQEQLVLLKFHSQRGVSGDYDSNHHSSGKDRRFRYERY